MIPFFFCIGAIGVFVSAFTLGAFTDGMQHRANNYTETKEDRQSRTKIGIYSGLLGFLALGIAALIYYV
ncbi:DUF5316 family protein [Bacillus carboniphilus]|uniref:DUF5316 family protein n=1 Tax=Bacillus carboniphilus TaxID=86663 RepID=A0ABY9JXH4_9BACI|nr:DUF5316 family protein [Bacillus carboniphilus]WLR43213.1 DUF5316 family protein [Bacillus carboniphilus]